MRRICEFLRLGKHRNHDRRGRICPQCEGRLTVESAPHSCKHCGWMQGMPVHPLPALEKSGEK